MTDDETTRRWREWSGARDDGSPPQSSGDTPTPSGPARPPAASRRFTARAMGVAGSSLIAGLAVVLAGLTALPGGAGFGRDASSSLRPAGTDARDAGGCISATRNLLCQRAAADFNSAAGVIDPLISATGPGTEFSSAQEFMIDGDPGTAWTSVGDPTGATILLKFREPVDVGTVGLAARPGPLDVSWSFEQLRQGTPACADGSDGPFVATQNQHLTDGQGTQPMASSVRTCKIRLQLDHVGAVGDLAISELTLLAP